MKRYISLIAVLLAVSLLFAGCNKKPATIEDAEEAAKEAEPVLVQLQDPQPGSELVTMETNFGDITFMLFPDDAPKAVENFIAHAKNGYYNGLTVDKVMNDCMIRMGDPTGSGLDMGKSIWPTQPRFDAEMSWNLWHFTGALAYYNNSAEEGKKENGSQFFIVSGAEITPQMLREMQDIFPDNVTQAYAEMGGQPGMDTHYTVFGQVIEGMDVVREIAALETQILAPEGDITVPRNGVPVEEVLITGFSFETVPEEASAAE